LEHRSAKHLGGPALLSALRMNVDVSGYTRVAVSKPFLCCFEIAPRASVQNRSARVTQQVQSIRVGLFKMYPHTFERRLQRFAE